MAALAFRAPAAAAWLAWAGTGQAQRAATNLESSVIELLKNVSSQARKENGPIKSFVRHGRVHTKTVGKTGAGRRGGRAGHERVGRGLA